jgi:thiol-disulfide isomerase/thioredoxin
VRRVTGSVGSRAFSVVALLAVGSMCVPGQQVSPPPAQPVQNSNAPLAVPETSAQPAETPGEIYKAAMHPLDVVRSSLDNWSDAELGALSVGIQKAHDACEAREPGDFAGDDLYDLARLCALGQDWDHANAAALAYVASKLDPHRAQAYALSVNALVHMNAIDLAVETTREMLRVLPYDAEVAYAVRYMKDDLEQASNPEALKLASEEHAAIVAALLRRVPLKSANGDAVMSVGALYDSAMDLAFWQRYAGEDVGATATLADVDGALGADAVLAADDASRIAAVRLRYGLLGTRLPEVKVLRGLAIAAKPVPVLRVDAPITVLVLFPDWCGGCRKMMKPLSEFMKGNKETPIHAYGLVFEDDSVIPLQAAHEELLKQMKGTSTLVVPAATAQTFGANDYPLGIVLDGQGKVRFIGVLPGDAFNGTGYVEKTILKIMAANPGLGIRMGEGKKR